MPQEEEQGWAQQGQEEAGGAWSSILAPALEVLVPGAGRASWVSGRARGAQGDDGDGGEDFEVHFPPGSGVVALEEHGVGALRNIHRYRGAPNPQAWTLPQVESQMLEPLTEGGGRKAKGGFKLRGAGRLRAGVKRNRNLAALGGAAAVLLLAGIWYSNTMSGYGEASALCASLTVCRPPCPLNPPPSPYLPPQLLVACGCTWCRAWIIMGGLCRGTSSRGSVPMCFEL